jgi:NADH-quinone oxidoreductase subunit J
MSAAALVPAVLATGLAETGTVSGGEQVLFWFVAPVMVIGALGLLFARRAVHAAMSVVVVMVGMAVLYTALEAPFLGVAQVVVYTGAVMMLFLFVLMLVGVDASDSLVETLRGQRWIGVLAGGGLLVTLIGVVLGGSRPAAVGLEAANQATNPVGVARLVFGEFVVAFELTGALLITAALGALTLTHRQRLTRKVGQREITEQKMMQLGAGGLLTPLPAPGVYARHNAANIPALGPSGEPISESVPRVLRIRGLEHDVPWADVAGLIGPGEDKPGAAREGTS